MKILFRNSKWEKIFLSVYDDCVLLLSSRANDSVDIANTSEEEIESAIVEVDNVAATYNWIEYKLLNFQPDV